MNFISFTRILKAGLTNFWRNIWLSTAATMIMIVTLIILSVLTLLFAVTSNSVKSIREKVDISAYFKTGVPESQVRLVQNDLEHDPLVKQVTYISPDEALQSFKTTHSNNSDITNALNELEGNPLPATLQVKANNLDDYPKISQELSSAKYAEVIDQVNFEDNRALIDRLDRLLRLIVTVGTALVIIFVVIAILVIFNTITLTIYNRREEVEIMRLVGATNWYIRGPFLMEALLYSVAATIITTIIILPLYLKFFPQITAYLNPDAFTAGATASYLAYFRYPYILAAQFVIAIILSAISSMLAIRRYLKI